jgi:hypothetical protein
MKNVYLQLACNILSKNQNTSYKGNLYIVVILSHLPQVTTIDRFDYNLILANICLLVPLTHWQYIQFTTIKSTFNVGKY